LQGETLLSADVEGDAQHVARALTTALECFNVMLTPAGPLLERFPPFARRFNRARARIDELIYRLIRERRASGEVKEDLLSLLLESRYDDGSAMSEEQVRDEALTLFVAGFETTSHALSWTWYLMAQHPKSKRDSTRNCNNCKAVAPYLRRRGKAGLHAPNFR
jgi:cytochrome P450